MITPEESNQAKERDFQFSRSGAAALLPQTFVSSMHVGNLRGRFDNGLGTATRFAAQV
jgi:hypothetical protein